jgi:uncharacterized protein (DUF1330 family)
MITLIPENFDAFLADDDGQPVVMLNLLRFKPEGGRDRYREYLAMAGPIVARYGAEISFAGDGLTALAAEAGQSWDAVGLVRYPNRRAFADMIADPEYAKANPLRMEALEEAVLQPVSPMQHQ